MRIRRISVYQLDLPYVGGSYDWAKGKSVTIADSTVVRIDTDHNIFGVGEVCPLPVYLPAYPGGVRAGLAELAPQLIGLDPTKVGHINTVMDARLCGHGYVKSAIDIACWDVLGKASDLPVHTLLGGRQMDAMPMYRAVSQDTPAAMVDAIKGYREQGYRQFQLKSGGYAADEIDRIRTVVDALAPGELMIADANTEMTASPTPGRTRGYAPGLRLRSKLICSFRHKHPMPAQTQAWAVAMGVADQPSAVTGNGRR